MSYTLSLYVITDRTNPTYGGRDETVRSTSHRSKRQGDQRVGGVADKEPNSVQTINIIFQWQYFAACCLSSDVANVFGLPSTHKPVT
jgi:hypothetical protein